MNILHLTPDFNYSDGRSYYVYLILKYLKKAGHNVFLSTNGGDSFDRAKELEIPVFVLPTLSHKSSFVNSLKYISQLADTNKINVIHSHHRYYELLATSLIRRKHLRTVFTALSIVDKRYFIEYKSDRIIAVSNCVKKMLIEKFNVKENKLSLIPGFVDSEELTGNRESPNSNRQSTVNNWKDGNTIYILSIGRFHREKNFETLFEAIALLKDYKIKLILIGEGGEKQRYENIIKENSLDIKMISPQKDLTPFFKIADMCVLTSIRDPFPGFMLQSGLHNKPFIGSNVDGIPEVIKNSENGLLFEKKNAFQLSERIKLFINNKLFAKKCSDNLSKLIFEKYTEKSVMPQIEKLYAGLF